ncbi:MAG: hypothetical protein MJ250_07550 [Alphaproteobacteria bacterium]|nr:hypothetical protein [Alphaproteobacteria bacterium]
MVKCPVKVGDVFQKAQGLTSKWVVDRVIEYSDIPLHVRLIEQGGNERTQTVALTALLDPHQWKAIPASDSAN